MRLGQSRLFWEVQGGCVMVEVGTVPGWQVGFHRFSFRAGKSGRKVGDCAGG